MVKTLYSFLLVGTSAGVGLVAVVGWLNVKLFQRDRDRRRKSLGILLLGMGLQNGILTYALIDQGTTDASWRAVMYAIGLSITTVGLAWKAGQFVQDLALEEALGDGPTPRGLWVQNTERRLTAEEARNTTIEHYAAAQGRRQDQADTRIAEETLRADETEGHA